MAGVIGHESILLLKVCQTCKHALGQASSTGHRLRLEFEVKDLVLKGLSH